MNTKLALLLSVYVLLLSATGYLTFVRFVGLPTVASANDIAQASVDPDFKKDLLDDVKIARERNGDLIKLSAHAFDVILGALLGFLSAVASGLGLTKATSSSNSQTTETGEKNLSSTKTNT